MEQNWATAAELRLLFIEPLKVTSSPRVSLGVEFDADAARLPPPIIADVNGDGVNEIVVATRNPPLLRVLSAPTQREALHSTQNAQPLLRARVRQRVSLLTSGVRIATGRYPVALATGPLVHGGADGKLALLSIVVLTDAWSVLCFNHKLELQWETVVQYQQQSLGIADLWIREAALLVRPNRVVVGGSMHTTEALEADAEAAVGSAPAQRDVFAHLTGADRRDVRSDEPVGLGGERGAHSYAARRRRAQRFSVYALEGARGRVVWARTADELDSPASAAAEKNAALPKWRPAGMQRAEDARRTCRRYRRSLATALRAHPHAWANRADTAILGAIFELDDLTASAASAPADRKAASARVGALAAAASLGHYVAGAGAAPAAGGRARSNTRSSSSSSSENVLLLHTRLGVEVLHLESGVAVCTEMLQPSALSVTADINGDGSVDRVSALQQLDLRSSPPAARQSADVGQREPAPRDAARTARGGRRRSGMSTSFQPDGVGESGAAEAEEAEGRAPQIVHCLATATTHVQPHRIASSVDDDAHAHKHYHHRRRQHQLYNASLCHRGFGSLSEALLLSLAEGDNAPSEARAARRARLHAMGMFRSVETAMPLLLQREHRPAAVGAQQLPGLLGGSAPAFSPRAVGGAMATFDAVFAVSTGLVTAIDPAGVVLWQTPTDVEWGGAVSADARRGVVPSVTALVLDGGGVGGERSASRALASHVLVAGARTAALLERGSGALRFKLRLPAQCAPALRPTVGDINADGVGDVVFLGADAICAYGAVQRTSTAAHAVSLLIGLLLALLLLAVVGAHVIAAEDDNEAGGGAMLHSRVRGRHRSSVARMLRRSTS